jgi:hypothetical protein
MARLFFTKEMTKQLKANRSSSISFLLVFSFGVSLFWCNDGNRFQIRANDNQGASVGSLQDLQACSQQNALDVSSSDRGKHFCSLALSRTIAASFHFDPCEFLRLL